MSDKKIVGVVPEDLLARLNRGTAMEAGLREIQDNLLSQHADLLKLREKLWEEIREKMGLSADEGYSVNKKTGELTVLER